MTPQVWLIHGPRAGDNAQVTAMADALGWPYAIKRISYNQRYLEGYQKLGPNLTSVDQANSDVLSPPWPDLIIAIGRRAVPVVQWIKSQAGGRVKLVHLGRPRCDLSLFDLVITTPQYGLPDLPNVLHLSAPLVRLDQEQLSKAAEVWMPRLKHLPKPWIAAIIGGDSFPYFFDKATAQILGRQLNEIGQQSAGSLLLTTSPRTAPEVAEALIAEISCPAFIHRFVQGMENPYFAYLALADRLVVTAESVSMLTEATLTGKPVEMAMLPAHPPRKKYGPKKKALQWLGRRRAHRRHAAEPMDRLDRLYEWFVERGEAKPVRDIAYFHNMLVARGLVRRFGATDGLPIPPRRDFNELDKAVIRVKALFNR